jgi:hypothetical protein
MIDQTSFGDIAQITAAVDNLRAENRTLRNTGISQQERIEELEAENSRLRAVMDAADVIYDEVQKQLEQNAGWMQFEYFSPELDLHSHIKLGKALADAWDENPPAEFHTGSGQTMSDFADAWDENPPAEYHRGGTAVMTDHRIDVSIKGITHKDLKDMVDAVFGSCVWVGGACYPDSECEIRILPSLDQTRREPCKHEWVDIAIGGQYCRLCDERRDEQRTDDE